MTSYIDSDQSLQVGDLVFSTYHKGDYIFKIMKITRRFYNAHDIKIYYPNRQVGDEYNPTMYVESIDNFSLIKSLSKKKARKTAMELDASYLIRVEPKHILEHINKLNILLNDI